MFATTIHHLNPLLQNLLQLLDEWSEYYCDVRTMAAVCDEVDTGCYFEVIMGSMRQMPEIIHGDCVFSMLCDSQLRLERRIDYMRKYTKIKTATKAAPALFAFVFGLMSVTTTYAAGSQVADLHDYIYQNVEVVATDSGIDSVLEEHYMNAAEDDSYDTLVYANPELELISPLLDANELVSFNWAVSPNTRHVSNTFRVTKGQSISMSTSVSPGTSTYWIGIMDGWNSVRYVEGSGSMSHAFAITTSGSYRVFVQNRGNADITAAGSYSFY